MSWCSIPLCCLSWQIKLWTVNHNHFLDKCPDVSKCFLRNLHTSTQNIDISQTAQVSAVLALLYSILFYSVPAYTHNGTKVSRHSTFKLLPYWVLRRSVKKKILPQIYFIYSHAWREDWLMKHTGIRKGPIRIRGPETEKKNLNLRNTN